VNDEYSGSKLDRLLDMLYSNRIGTNIVDEYSTGLSNTATDGKLRLPRMTVRNNPSEAAAILKTLLSVTCAEMHDSIVSMYSQFSHVLKHSHKLQLVQELSNEISKSV
jgi:hypothetical protein